MVARSLACNLARCRPVQSHLLCFLLKNRCLKCNIAFNKDEPKIMQFHVKFHKIIEGSFVGERIAFGVKKGNTGWDAPSDGNHELCPVKPLVGYSKCQLILNIGPE